MRIRFDDRAIHERARVALVGVADEELLVALRVAGGVPLEPRRESRTPAPSETRRLDLLDNLLRRHARAAVRAKNLRYRLVAIDRTICVYGFGVYDAAMPQRDSRLL